MELDGEIVIYHEGQHAAHLVNDAGALLWQLFDGITTINELAADVSAVFGVSHTVAADQVRSFADQMGELGLLLPSGEPAE